MVDVGVPYRKRGDVDDDEVHVIIIQQSILQPKSSRILLVLCCTFIHIQCKSLIENSYTRHDDICTLKMQKSKNCENKTNGILLTRFMHF